VAVLVLVREAVAVAVVVADAPTIVVFVAVTAWVAVPVVVSVARGVVVDVTTEVEVGVPVVVSVAVDVTMDVEVIVGVAVPGPHGGSVKLIELLGSIPTVLHENWVAAPMSLCTPMVAPLPAWTTLPYTRSNRVCPS
jgi:hypothetical protein